MLTKKQKQDVVKKYGVKKGDTGSPQVQIALLTNQIDQLTGHLKEHKKDNHSRKGLLKMVGKRRRLLNYLAQTNKEAFDKVSKDLGIKTTSLQEK